ncbi:L,D-transpeptidase family protein [Aquihabitans daechungensis]|uniref:L,D-transpeptidase family protein n=1 Tax=Aquihabitans daechungensis TaxID=1052257 RepID=UPI003BA16E36
MPPSIDPRVRRTARGAAPVVLVVVAIVAAVALLGSCSGERASLGSLPPKLPASSTTTVLASTTTTAAPEPADLKLGPEDLLGWIATPLATPEVYAEASTGSSRIEVGAKTEAGAPTTFAVIGDASPGAELEVPGWYRVALRDRPNGSTGWMPASSVKITKTPFRIFVDLRARTLRVEKDATGVFTTEVAIGTEENPTPVNGTYVTELIANTNPGGSYGPYAFGLAMHSDTLSEFGGGDGQVGIHGTNRPELIGQAVSHGCVRLTNDDVQELVDLDLPLGVPVFIT